MKQLQVERRCFCLSRVFRPFLALIAYHGNLGSTVDVPLSPYFLDLGSEVLLLQYNI